MARGRLKQPVGLQPAIFQPAQPDHATSRHRAGQSDFEADLLRPVADDVDGDPVFLAKNEFYLGYTRERAEGIVFSSIKDVKKKT